MKFDPTFNAGLIAWLDASYVTPQLNSRDFISRITNPNMVSRFGEPHECRHPDYPDTPPWYTFKLVNSEYMLFKPNPSAPYIVVPIDPVGKHPSESIGQHKRRTQAKESAASLPHPPDPVDSHPADDAGI